MPLPRSLEILVTRTRHALEDIEVGRLFDNWDSSHFRGWPGDITCCEQTREARGRIADMFGMHDSGRVGYLESSRHLES